MQRLLLLGIGLLTGVTSGCHRSEPVHNLTANQRDEIQSRATNHFPRVVMFKPEDGGLETPLTSQLAPLLIQAITAATATQITEDHPGPTNSTPLVFVHTNEINIHTNRYAQFSYVWNYPPTEASPRSLATQGVRITLDSRGAPVLWEVLADSTGADVIFVAQSLEVLARAEFGLPTSGRKFAVERAPTADHRTVVANIIDDGPVPMGPILYLQAGSRDVTALICRCMPAQFDALSGQQDYQLQATTAASAGFSKNPLAQRLRLPSRF